MRAFSFGLLTDLHYADRPEALGRFYRCAPDKAARCAALLNGADVDFTVHLGDLVDSPGRPDPAGADARRILREFARLRRPCRFVPGNHDVDSLPRDFLFSLPGAPSPAGYASFDHKGVHFVMLDTNFDAQGRPYTPGNGRWEFSHIGAEQLGWLRRDLAGAPPGPVVVFSHALLDGQGPHTVRDAEPVRELLERCGRPAAVFQGHRHAGGMSRIAGIPYCTLRASAEGGPDGFCCWAVTVEEAGMRACVFTEDGRRSVKVL